MKKINNIPEHVAIILDGNGRWAKRRGLPRSAGHYSGGLNLAKIVVHANKLGIKQLSVYAFSTENWNRPKDEVDFLMSKPIEVINKNIDKIINSQIKIKRIGRTDRIPKALLDCITNLENLTSNHTGVILNICIDYGSYDEILTAAQKTNNFDVATFSSNLMIEKPVDLLIRTGGELRLSNFMLWQSSYAELYFVKKCWPAFKPRDLTKAVLNYSKRNRRYGGIKK